VEESQDNLSTRKKLLTLLKLRGPQTASELADHLEITAVAVRQHIQGLSQAGMLEYTERRQPVGRPARCWRLSKTARALFPDNHGKLSIDILDAVNQTFGAEGVDQVLQERARKQRARYLKLMPGPSTPLKERVEALARLRNEEGYMVECVAKDDGRWLLVENNCPICSAAEHCGYFCSSEPIMFESLLGEDASIRRTEHCLDDTESHHCVYEITAVTDSEA